MASIASEAYQCEAYKSDSEAYQSDDETIDTQWLDTFKENEKLYNDYYTEPVNSITIFIFYVNRDNDLERVHTDICLLETNGCLKRDIIISYIKHYEMFADIKYKLRALLKYNINLKPDEINDFMSENTAEYNKRFFSYEKYLNDIYFENSIHMFQDLNALYFIFNETTPSSKYTKRVILSTTEKDKSHRKTKRHNYHKKNLKIVKEII
jgi:hypothetical protein